VNGNWLPPGLGGDEEEDVLAQAVSWTPNPANVVMSDRSAVVEHHLQA
jgi:hypothetical protein